MTIASATTRSLTLARRFWSRFALLPATVQPIGVAADLCCRSRHELGPENAPFATSLELSVVARPDRG